MARFFGVVSGRGRTTASRVGRKTTGLHTVAASWQGAVKVSLYERDGTDHALVELTPWCGAGVSRVLYAGSVAGDRSRARCLVVGRNAHCPEFFLLLTRCLPGRRALLSTSPKSLKTWRARRDSNSRPLPSEGNASPGQAFST
jgi:hypothetical protein